MITVATVDVDALRKCLIDYCGSAMASGFPAAVLDVSDIEHADGEELCGIAERLGIDLTSFAIGQ